MLKDGRQPTRDERAKEASVLNTALADAVILVFLFITGFATLSMTVISEAVRATLMLCAEFYSYAILRSIHRERLGRFRFGIAKLEQFCNLLIGSALILSALWIADHISSLIVLGGSIATPMGLAIAAIVNGANTLINVLGFLAMRNAASSDDGVVFKAQLRARGVKTLSSLFVQGTVTIAALANDPVLAMSFDALGGAFVVCLQLVIGVRMVGGSIPDLLDHSMDTEKKNAVNARLRAAHLDPSAVTLRRTRRNGSRYDVELRAGLAAFGSTGDVLKSSEYIWRDLAKQFPDVDVTIVADVETVSQPVQTVPFLERRWGVMIVSEALLLVLLLGSNLFLASPILQGLVVVASLLLIADLVDRLALAHVSGKGAHLYEFGGEKLQQAARLGSSGLSVAAGIWLLVNVLSPTHSIVETIPQADLAFAAGGSAVYFLFCLASVLLVPADTRPKCDRTSSTRTSRVVVSGVLFAVSTVTALTSDAILSTLLCSIAVLSLASVLLVCGGKYAYLAVLDIIDYPITPAAEADLRYATSKISRDFGTVVDVRARRVGGVVFVHLDVCVPGSSSLSDFRRFVSEVRQAVASRFSWLSVSISLGNPSRFDGAHL